MTSRKHICAVVSIGLLATATSCEREIRDFRPEAAQAIPIQVTALTDFKAGGPGGTPAATFGAVVGQPPRSYENRANDLSEGKRLYQAFNCYGCHAHGGGDMGPPLMDDKWIYGSQAEQVFNSIVAGRPNGMPAFGSKIPVYEVWQLAAYVRSMSGLTSKDAAPGRDDDMKSSPPENSAPTSNPVSSSATAVETQQ
jgi:cytochrome c oxidase cbb3-type subunit 3